MFSPKVNLWLRRIASVLSLFYCAAVCQLAYFSVFYDINITDKPITCLAVSGISIAAIAVMLFSRKQFFTKLSAIIIIPALLPIVLFYYGSWVIIIPTVITAITVFFLSGMKESTKTVLGTIFLLLFVIGALAYFIVCTLFSTSVQKETISTGVSVSEKYRYRIVNAKDSSNGSTTVYVEPNDIDYNFKLVNFSIKGFEKTIYVERPVAESVNINWKVEKRDDITEQLLDISSEITLNLSTEQKALIGKENEEEVLLSELTDEDFELLGVDEEGDVLYINDEPYFRYYIAELEEYFDLSNRKITFFEN